MISSPLVIVALGANIPSRLGPPRAALEAAVGALNRCGIQVIRQSRWFVSAPEPTSAQPRFVNGVILGRSSLSPDTLIGLLHRLERRFGRQRRAPGGPRVLDLDLIDAYGLVVNFPPSGGCPSPPGALILPHARAHTRRFVLIPLAEVAPAWRHPVYRHTAKTLASRLGRSGRLYPLGSANGRGPRSQGLLALGVARP